MWSRVAHPSLVYFISHPGGRAGSWIILETWERGAAGPHMGFHAKGAGVPRGWGCLLSTLPRPRRGLKERYLAIPKVCSGDRSLLSQGPKNPRPGWMAVASVATSNPKTSSAPSQISFWGWVVEECRGREFSHNPSEITSSAACTQRPASTDPVRPAAAMRKCTSAAFKLSYIVRSEGTCVCLKVPEHPSHRGQI